MRRPVSKIQIAAVAATAAVIGGLGGYCAAFQPQRRVVALSSRRPCVHRQSDPSPLALAGLDVSDGIDPSSAMLVPPPPPLDAAVPSPPPDASSIPLGNGAATDTLVFVVGLIPFLWATVEFWRRIAVGESFGTGSDSVVIIGEDGRPQSSRGRRVLGRGALAAAYVLFGIAALSVGVAVLSVVTSPGTMAGGTADATNVGASGDIAKVF